MLMTELDLQRVLQVRWTSSPLGLMDDGEEGEGSTLRDGERSGF